MYNSGEVFIAQLTEFVFDILYNIILLLHVITLYRYSGCGNGKYLSVNHSVFKIGVDRCKRFTDIAREKENEVYINYIYRIKFLFLN